MTIALWQRPLARVVMGIVKSANGAWFDPSDMSTLYQNAAGTIPVTAVEQPVGLMLDKSRGMMLGPELTPTSYSGSVAGLWIISPAIVSRNSDTFNSATFALGSGISSGKFYKVTFNIANKTGDDVIVRVGGGTGDYARFSGNGAVSAVLKAVGSGSVLFFAGYAGTTGTADITNISVKELYGNHATQSITASRPTLSARYNLLTKTEDFSDVAWLKNSMTLTNAGIFQGSTFFSIQNSGASYTQAYLRATTNKIGSTIYVNSFYVKKGNTDFVFIRDLSTQDKPAYFNLNTGLFETVGAGLTANATSLQDGWYLLEVSVTTPSSVATNLLDIGPATLNNDDRKSNPGSYVYVCKPSVCMGPKYTHYQRVNTATDYDTDERYFKKYLRFDGVDDFINLPYMGLYAGGSASVVIARSNASTFVNQTVISEGHSVDANPVYMLDASAVAYGSGAFIRNSAGSQLIETRTDVYGVNQRAVVSFTDNGASIKRYENGAISKDNSYTRTGVLALTNTVIGALSRTSITNYFGNNLYGLIITKSALTDAQRIKCERYLGRKSGVQL